MKRLGDIFTQYLLSREELGCDDTDTDSEEEIFSKLRIDNGRLDTILAYGVA